MLRFKITKDFELYNSLVFIMTEEPQIENGKITNNIYVLNTIIRVFSIITH